MTLRLEAVSKTVGGEVHLHPLDITLAPGSMNVVLGPTLAGKTSLMRLMAGLDRPSSGRVLVGDHDVTGLSVRRRKVAMVYQQFINYPSFTVYDNIASPLRRAKIGRAEIDRRVREAAAMLRLDGLLDRLPDALSGGQQQRTALARALVKEADLLLLDEPLVNLDFKLREELREELRALFETRRTIVVYATTEPLEALMIGGDTLVLDQGRLLQAGPTVSVYRTPACVRVGEVFSDPPINLIAGDVGADDIRLGGAILLPRRGHLRVLAPGAYRFGVRAHHLSVDRRHGDEVAVEGTVVLDEINGSETFIHVELGDALWVVQEEGVHGFGLGERIRFFLDPRHVFAFAPDGALVAAPVGGDDAMAVGSGGAA